MNNEEIIKRLKSMFSMKLEIDEEKEMLEESTPLIDYGIGVDSVSTMELIVALEKEFGIEIDEAEVNIEIFRTMNTVADYVSGKLESG